MTTSHATAGEDGPDADPQTVARAICLRLLSDRPRTRSQLSQALAARRVPTEAAEAVLDRFTEVGLIDDAAFADAWVATRHRGRGLARRALREELRQRGVDPGTAAAALKQVDVEDEQAAARDLVARRLPSLARLPRPAQQRRLAGLLGRKGYPPGLAQQVIRDALESGHTVGSGPRARNAGEPDPVHTGLRSEAASPDA